MNKTKYIQKATLMLSDKNTYEPLKKTPQIQYIIKQITSLRSGRKKLHQ